MYIEFTAEEQKILKDIQNQYEPRLKQIAKECSMPIKDKDKGAAKKRQKLLWEQQTLLDKLQADHEKFFEKAQQEHFKPIMDAGTAAIIESAKEQAPLILDSFYNSVRLNPGGEGLELLGIGKQEGDSLFVNASVLAEDLRSELKLHIKALEDNEAAQQEIFKIIVRAINDCDFAIEDKYKKAAISAIPNGESIAFLSKILNLKGGRIALDPGNNRHNSIKSFVTKDNSALHYITENKKKGTSIEVTITQADKYLRKSRKGTEKLLIYVLQSMTEQHYPSSVRLFLNDLVEDGLYSTTSNAKRGIIDFFEQQKLLTLKGKVKKNRQTVVEEGGILFYNYKFDRGKGIIDLQMNENFNVDFIANYYSVFPRFAYALKNNNAFSLVRYIFYIARQRTRELKASGTFTIQLETIRENLGLPSMEEVKINHKRNYRYLIIEPIEAAIEEIEEALQREPDAQNRSFTITPIVPDNANISEWLNGYVEIGLSGTFAKSFVEIATKAEEDRKKWERLKLTQQAKMEVYATVKTDEK